MCAVQSRDNTVTALAAGLIPLLLPTHFNKSIRLQLTTAKLIAAHINKHSY